MRAIQLSSPFADPQHVRRKTIMPSPNLRSQSSLIGQDQSLMRREQFLHMIRKVVMGDNRIEISLQQFFSIRLTVFMMLAIYIISFIIMDLLPIMMGELVATRFGVLPCDPTDQGDRV
jgi:hypothetical protein